MIRLNKVYVNLIIVGLAAASQVGAAASAAENLKLKIEVSRVLLKPLDGYGEVCELNAWAKEAKIELMLVGNPRYPMITQKYIVHALEYLKSQNPKDWKVYLFLPADLMKKFKPVVVHGPASYRIYKK